MKTAFPPGSWVYVRSIRKTGMVEAVSARSVSVVVGSLRLRCAPEDLSPAPRPAQSLRPDPGSNRSGHRRRAQARIDLHGLRVLDAVQKTAQALDDALREGVDALHIIHGIGEGKVRDGVHQYLATLTVVRHFAVDPLNPGVTKVYL